tara:strand:- start:78 stop:530 length:453 start_codon:yes stop_codon:yes gene_type:complete
MSAFQRSIMMGMAGGFDIITASNAENINLRTLLDAAGFNNDVPTRITYTLNASINVTSAASTGTATPAWQTGTIGSIHTVTVYINGAVKGYGGAGGAGGAHGASGSAGANASGSGSNGSGGAGGSTGYAVAKNSNTVTTTNNGTISGTQG